MRRRSWAKAPLADAVVIFEDFESVVPKNTPINPLTRPIGVFTGVAGVDGFGNPFPNVAVAAPGATNFGPGNNPTETSILSANGDESFDVALSLAATTVSLDLFLNDLGPAALSFFNGTTLLQSFSYAADSNSANNFLNQSYTSFGAPITRFTFVSTLGRQLNTGIDNVSATDAAVPEPATWAMMIAGFGMIGFALRWRQRAIGRHAA